MNLRYQYSIAAGSNIALASLVNIENLFGKTKYAPNRQNPVDVYPVRTVTFSGRVTGEGRINHEWTFKALPIALLKLIEDNYHTNGTVTSAQVTIYTRLHNRATYVRYNAWSILPQPGEDYEYDRGYARNLVWKFHNLVVSS